MDFRKGWDAQRSKVSAKETYTIQKENEVAFLKAKDANQRVYTKQISWNPKTHPILTWRWRIPDPYPENAEFSRGSVSVPGCGPHVYPGEYEIRLELEERGREYQRGGDVQFHRNGHPEWCSTHW